MGNALSGVNWISVLLATAVFALFGALWFNFIVPKHYVVAMGRERAPKHVQTSSDYGVQLACIFAMTLTSALLMRALQIDTMQSAVQFGLLIALGYFLPMVGLFSINPNFPRPLLYSMINMPYFLVGNLLASAILASFR